MRHGSEREVAGHALDAADFAKMTGNIPLRVTTGIDLPLKLVYIFIK